MLTHDDKNYEIKLNLRVIKQIEGVLEKGIMAVLRESNGMLSINDLTTIAGYGLYNEDGNRISPAQGIDIAEQFLIEKGYAELITLVVEALERDCPFFFQAG